MAPASLSVTEHVSPLASSSNGKLIKQFSAVRTFQTRQSLTEVGPLYASRVPNPMATSFSGGDSPRPLSGSLASTQIGVIVGACILAIALFALICVLLRSRRTSSSTQTLNVDHPPWSNDCLTRLAREADTLGEKGISVIVDIPPAATAPDTLHSVSSSSSSETFSTSISFKASFEKPSLPPVCFDLEDRPFQDVYLDEFNRIENAAVKSISQSSCTDTYCSDNLSSSSIRSSSATISELGEEQPEISDLTDDEEGMCEETFEVRQAQSQCIEITKGVTVLLSNPSPLIAKRSLAHGFASSQSRNLLLIPELLVTGPSCTSFSTFQSSYSACSLSTNEFPLPPVLLAGIDILEETSLAVPKRPSPSSQTKDALVEARDCVLNDMIISCNEKGECSVTGRSMDIITE